MSVAIVIPAYNAAAHIEGVLERVAALRECNIDHVVVVNDGSRDHTLQLVRQARFTRCALTIVDHPKNAGYGAAMKSGLEAARSGDPELVACVHADGQYSPEALPALCRALHDRGLDLLQGSRIASGAALSGGMPLYKYVANAALNQLENHTLKLDMTDYHSGYLLYGRRALALPFRALSNSFDFDLEVIASARAQKLAVGEAPIPTHYGSEVSHLNPISYGLRVLRVLWNYRRGHYAAL